MPEGKPYYVSGQSCDSKDVVPTSFDSPTCRFLIHEAVYSDRVCTDHCTQNACFPFRTNKTGCEYWRGGSVVKTITVQNVREKQTIYLQMFCLNLGRA